MSRYKSPGVYITEVQSRVSAIVGVSTSNAAFVGVAEKGPLDEAVLINNYSEFYDNYGSPVTGDWLAHAVRLFFENGGARLYIARVDAGAGTVADEQQYKSAFSLLDGIHDIGLIAAPGIGSSTMIDFAAEYCQERGDCFYIADIPEIDNTADMAIERANTFNANPYAAVYFPWIEINDVTTNTIITIPPSGAVAGIYAQTDMTRGVWKAPAGIEAKIYGATGLALNISGQKQDALNSSGINTIRIFPEKGMVIWGARTLDSRPDAEFRYVNIRRTVNFIEQSIIQGIHWAVFETNDEMLWAKLRAVISNFLMDIWREGGLTGSAPNQAYFVECGHNTNTQNDIDNGIVNVVIGIAPLRPAEFVIIRISQRINVTKN